MDPKLKSSQANGISEDHQNGKVVRQESKQSVTSSVPTQSLGKRLRSWRVCIAIQMHFSIVLLILQRSNLTIALVCMIDSTALNESSSTSSGDDVTSNNASFNYSGGAFDDVSQVVTKTGEFRWASSIQGLLLTSSNMLGFVMPLMTDYVTRKLGGHRVLQLTFALASVLTLLQPMAARLSPYALMAARLIIGLVGGTTLPIVGEVFSWWAPANEKVSMVSFAFAGVNVGNILVGVTSAYLCAIPVDNGWPFIFYVQGALGLVWCLVWQLFGSMRPEDHKYVSEEEQQYINKTRLGMNRSQERTSPPYRAILTTRGVWAFLVVMICHNYAVTIIFTFLPLYLKSLFGISIEKIGLLTSLGFIARFAGVILWGQFSNCISAKSRLSVTVCRKAVQCSGFYVSTLCCLLLGWTGSLPEALGLMSVLLFAQSVTLVAGFLAPLDMAPRYVTFLTGLSTTTATIIAMPAPIITSLMTEEGTLEGWRNVFIVMGAVFFIGATIFLLMADSALQSWAVPKDGDRGTDKKNGVTLASDLMTRRLTVLSLGPPISPEGDRSRFNFSLTVQPNFTEAAIKSRPQAQHATGYNPATVTTNGAAGHNVYVDNTTSTNSVNNITLTIPAVSTNSDDNVGLSIPADPNMPNVAAGTVASLHPPSTRSRLADDLSEVTGRDNPGFQAEQEVVSPSNVKRLSLVIGQPAASPVSAVSVTSPQGVVRDREDGLVQNVSDAVSRRRIPANSKDAAFGENERQIVEQTRL